MSQVADGPASFSTQANALLRKNLTFQKRNCKTHACLAAFPILFCLLLFSFQIVIKNVKHRMFCDCVCAEKQPDGSCDKMKCVNDSTSKQSPLCPVPKAKPYPPVLHIPSSEYRAVRTKSIPFVDLPDESCRSTDSCPVTMLYTGGNKSFAQSVLDNSYSADFDINGSSPFTLWDNLYLASMTETDTDFSPYAFIYNLQSECPENFTLFDPKTKLDIGCLPSLHLWRESSSVIKNETNMGFFNLNPERKINEIAAAYDFLNSNEKIFNVSIWYNVTDDDPMLSGFSPRLVNAVSNSYLQLLGGGIRMPFDFVKAMPTWPNINLEFLSIFRPLLFSWIILQLFPVILSSLVYEKQQKLRIMMKMHGLGDGPYWIISYVYFCLLSSIYTLCLVVSGSLVGLEFFTQTRYSIQFVFYFAYINLQIAHAFLVSSFFSNVKTATVIGYLYAFGSGLLGLVIFQSLAERSSFPSVGRILLETLPCFSLYRGLYELEQYSFTINGIQWKDLSTSGMTEVLIIMLVEWLAFLLVTYYCDQVASVGSGVRKHPLFFLKNFHKRSSLNSQQPSRQGSGVSIQMEKLDVSLERKKVEQLLLEPSTGYAIVCDNLKKMYTGKDGGPDKFAVRDLSLALPQGECFGMLGPNGAGKTSSINMMIGLMMPTSGTVYIHGLDIKMAMDRIYSSMGVCPQDNLLWETLTAREHLLFYGRLKNLKGDDLTQAVEGSLKSVNLFSGGVGDKQAGKYSGGMKRRLSVAISLIGNPKVVYMDEPSSGLDPASRKILWDAVKRAKRTCAIILTTHSMEEAEVLCDRLGIIVDGSLQCIGNPTELKARYGETRMLTVTAAQAQEKEVENLVRQLSPSAEKVYHQSGTQKFELHKDKVSIAEVFKAVEKAKKSFPVYAWGLTDTTLEDVFIKVSEGAQKSNEL